ncbi:MAG TPA: hypothetical protein VGC84_07490 [Ilumatobacteraceae bacterium]
MAVIAADRIRLCTSKQPSLRSVCSRMVMVASVPIGLAAFAVTKGTAVTQSTAPAISLATRVIFDPRLSMAKRSPGLFAVRS